MKILIVDDHAPFVDGLRNLLQQQIEGLEVETAGTLKAAIRIANDWQADITLLDPGLPDATMEDVLSHIESDFPPPVIVITGYPDPDGELLKLSYRYGAMDFFEKRTLNGNLIRSIHNNYLRYKLHPKWNDSHRE